MSRYLTPWLDAGDDCVMRCLIGTDVSKVENRVAFIEKTARIRVGLPGPNMLHDNVNWMEGYKGSRGDTLIGQMWCDDQLFLQGWDIYNEYQVFGACLGRFIYGCDLAGFPRLSPPYELAGNFKPSMTCEQLTNLVHESFPDGVPEVFIIDALRGCVPRRILTKNDNGDMSFWFSGTGKISQAAPDKRDAEAILKDLISVVWSGHTRFHPDLDRLAIVDYLAYVRSTVSK